MEIRPDEDWRQPDRKLLRLRRLEVGTAAAVLAIAGVVVAVTGSLAGGIVLLVAALFLALTLERFLRRRFEAWGYAERQDDLLVRRGVLFSRLSVIPYGRMQFIDVTAGPLERALGLATVKMHTAAAASDARIPGLDRTEAERLRDRLAELGEAQAAGL